MRFWLPALLSLLLPPCLAGAASLSGTLPALQMNPAMLRYFDPAPEAAATNHPGSITMKLDQHYASIMLADSLPAPARYLADMELYLAAFRLTYAPAGNLDITISLPLIYAYRGIFDPAIRQFHNAFGMPDNGRSLRPDNRFDYRFNGAAGGWNASPGWALGNIDMRVKYGLMQNGETDISLLGAAKLPTASRSKEWSSGSADIAAGAALSREGEELFHHLNLWGVKPLTGTDFGYPVKPYFRASLTSGWRPGWLASWLEMPVALLMQLQGGSSPYRTGLLQMDRPPWLISFGSRFVSDSGNLWSLTFVENITQRSTQDFGISAGVEFPLD